MQAHIAPITPGGSVSIKDEHVDAALEPFGLDHTASPWMAGPDVLVYSIASAERLVAVESTGKSHVFTLRRDAAHFWDNAEGCVSLKLSIGGGMYGRVFFDETRGAELCEAQPRTWDFGDGHVVEVAPAAKLRTSQPGMAGRPGH